jgi:hypothetical protein
VQGYTDSDWGGNEDGRSISGFAFLISGGAISWSARLQDTLALSSMEAEWIAACEAGKEAMWLQEYLIELGFVSPSRFVLFCDNQACISFSKEHRINRRTKHIPIQFNYTRRCVEEGKLILMYVFTGENVADIFTKALGRVKLVVHRKNLGLESILEEEIQELMEDEAVLAEVSFTTEESSTDSGSGSIVDPKKMMKKNKIVDPRKRMM